MLSDELPDFAEADRDLLQRVKGFLHQRGYGPHRTLEINVEQGVVVVQGRVPTFYMRQIAFECIKRVAGVTQVVDLIQVGDSPLQRQASVNSEDAQVSSDSSTRHGMHLQDTVQTGHVSPHTHIRTRHLLSTANG